MGASLGASGTMSDINMTPLIDIVLVVLIIMMVNIPVQVEEMGVKLPAVLENPPPPPPDQVDQLVIALYQDGKIALNRTVYADEDIYNQVTQRLKAMSNKIVFVDAHPEVEYGRVVDMVDLAREAGAEKVAFAKLKEEGPVMWTEVGEGGMPLGVYLGSPGVAGAITEKSAYDQFQPMLPQVRSCYDLRRTEVPTLRGRVVLDVAIGPEGEIMSSEILTNTTEDQGLADCIVEKLPALKYEALGYPNTARMHYPFIFSPG